MAITSSPSKSALSTPVFLVVPILVLVLYLLPGSLAGKLIGDGEQLTSRNAQVTEPFSWPSVWLSATPSHAPARQAYRPVLAHLLRTEYQVWQGSPSSYHAVSLLLFLGIVILFLLLSGKLTNHAGARLAAVVTLALHPMFTQAVENVAGQGVLLSLLATLGALYVFQFYRQGRLGLGWSAPLLTLLAVVAVGSHELGLLLPLWLLAVAALTRVAPPSRPREKKGRKRSAKAAATEAAALAPAPLGTPARVLAFALPLAAVVVGDLFLRAKALGGVTPLPLAGLGSVLAQAPAIFAAYLGRLCWPVHPTYYYLLAEKGAILPPPALGWLILLALLALTGYACRHWPALGLGLILMLTPLLALAHFIPLATFMSEQPLAFALPGFCLVIGAIVGRLTAPAWLFPPERLRERAVLGLLCLAWLALAWQSFARVRQWSSPQALWTAEAALHPASAQPLIEQLDARVRQSNADEARRFAREARRLATPAELDRVIELEALLAANIKDDDRLKELIDETLDENRQPGLDTLSRVAVFARDRDFRAESIDLWHRELKLYPTAFDALYELAQVELDSHNLKEAIRLASSAVKAAQQSLSRKMWARAQERYGIILAEAGRTREAAMTLQQALMVDKSLYKAYIYLARILWGGKEYQQARGVLDTCFLNVGSSLTSYVDLAQMYTGILEDQKMKRQALDWIQQQMASFPRDVSLQIWGALYLIQSGFYDQAYQAYQGLISTPMTRDDKARMSVGLGLLALRVNKQPAEAARFWRQALQLDPSNEDAKHLLENLDQPAATASPATPAAPANPAQAPTPAPAAKLSSPAAKPSPAPANAAKPPSPAPAINAAKPSSPASQAAKPSLVPVPAPAAPAPVAPAPAPAPATSAPQAPPAPASTPAAAPAPAPSSGAGVSLGAPLAGLSVSRPDLATSPSKPITPPPAAK